MKTKTLSPQKAKTAKLLSRMNNAFEGKDYHTDSKYTLRVQDKGVVIYGDFKGSLTLSRSDFNKIIKMYITPQELP